MKQRPLPSSLSSSSSSSRGEQPQPPQWSLIQKLGGSSRSRRTSPPSASNSPLAVVASLTFFVALVVILSNTILLLNRLDQQSTTTTTTTTTADHLFLMATSTTSAGAGGRQSSSSSGRTQQEQKQLLPKHQQLLLRRSKIIPYDGSASSRQHQQPQQQPQQPQQPQQQPQQGQRTPTHDDVRQQQQQHPPPPPPYGSCAVLFFGLPRSFRKYVLPSIVRNVIIPNVRYGCDYYVHYYHVEKEDAGRSGRGGTIHPDDVYLLLEAIEEAYSFFFFRTNGTTTSKDAHPHPHPHPHVSITRDTNESFWTAREKQIMWYRTAKNKDDGKYIYFPYSEPTYVYPNTLDNIVKQWHSIDAVWNDMEAYNNRINNKSDDGTKYRRVAMMRNDVIYITPIDIYQLPAEKASAEASAAAAADNNNGTDRRAGGPIMDYGNTHVVIPNWANYPINDRFIVGPYDAVKAWATQRFERIDNYAHNEAPPGKGMHSETFLNASIVSPLIQQKLGYHLVQDDFICFLRVRADGAIWIDDCSTSTHVGSVGGGGGGGNGVGGSAAQGFPSDPMEWLRPLLPPNATCRRRKLKDNVRLVFELVCREDGKGGAVAVHNNNHINTPQSSGSRLRATLLKRGGKAVVAVT